MDEQIKNDDIKKILEENLKLTQETYKIVKKIKSHIFLEQVLNIIKILVIVIPIVLGVIYLPTLLKPYLDQYQQIINSTGSTNLNPMDIQGIIEELKNK